MRLKLLSLLTAGILALSTLVGAQSVTRNPYISGAGVPVGPIFAADGSCTAGSVPYSFTNYTNVGWAAPSGLLTACSGSSTIWTLNSSGAAVLTAGGEYRWSGRTRMFSSASGILNLYTTSGGSTGVDLDFTTYGTLHVKQGGADTATVRANALYGTTSLSAGAAPGVYGINVTRSVNNDYLGLLTNSYSGANSYGLRVVTTGSTSASTTVFEAASLGASKTFSVFNNGNVTVQGDVTVAGGATLLTTSSALTDGAAAQTGTLTNSPAAGNPTKWIAINDNGTTRYIPAW